MFTTDRTIRRGSKNERGWCELVEDEAEEIIDSLGPTDEFQSLASLVHLTDLHICDAESPARIEYLDRLSDPDSPVREAVGHIGSYRPQEILTVQVADAMLRTVNHIARGPVTQRNVDAVLITGDVTDNAQRNELQWYRRLLDGGTVGCRSGDEGSSAWVGASRPDLWDERYWHPDGPEPGRLDDRPTRIEGFPRCPGLVTAARADFETPGLRHRWISVHGNHDGLLQGTLPATDAARDIAVGNQRITGLPANIDPSFAVSVNAMIGPVEYSIAPDFPREQVSPDRARRPVHPGEHANVLGMAGNYGVEDVGELVLIYLDTVNPHGGWQGSIDLPQFEWLKGQLRLFADRYVVVTSHHPSPTMINDYAPEGEPRRVTGDEVVNELLTHEGVIAWIAGHVHFHAALVHESSDGRPHFLEITSSALIDWPQQGRVVEIFRSAGRIGVASTVIDHDSPIDWRGALTCGWTQDSMASLSRVLAANDYQLRADPNMRALRDSTPELRNRIWWLPDRLPSASGSSR